MKFDAIIVGAGAAGLSAALRAASKKMHVALLDASDGMDSDFAKSGGSASAAGTRYQEQAGVIDTPEIWLEDISRKTGGVYDQTVVELVTRRSRDAVHFLADTAGIPIHLMTGIPVVGHQQPRQHATPKENGREFAELMTAAATRMPEIVRHNGTEVIELADRDNGNGIGGVTVRLGSRRETLAAPFTILACGGFAANRGFLSSHIPEMVGARNIGCPNNRGDGIVWALNHGASTGFMDSYQGHGHVTVDGPGRLGYGLTSAGAILVNINGKRFVREDIGPSELAAYVLTTPDGTAIEIYDRAAHEMGLNLGVYREVVKAGYVRSAENAGDFARIFGLPSSALAETIESYNRFAAGETKDPFGRSAFARPLHFPLWGAHITGALAHTQGGVLIDIASRVIRSDGQPVPGLLAAGGTVVGISGHGAAGYSSGNGLAQAFTLGMIAADTAAAR